MSVVALNFVACLISARCGVVAFNSSGRSSRHQVQSVMARVNSSYHVVQRDFLLASTTCAYAYDVIVLVLSNKRRGACAAKKNHDVDTQSTRTYFQMTLQMQNHQWSRWPCSLTAASIFKNEDGWQLDLN